MEVDKVKRIYENIKLAKVLSLNSPTQNEEEQKYGSVILTFILIYALLPVVLKFIVERIFKKLFSN